MSGNNIVSVKDISKIYHIYTSPLDRFKEALNPLKKSYHQDFYALHNISLDMKKGETVGLIGQNGAGKSTLLKIITGVVTQTQGSIEVKGSVSSLLELGAGFNPEMTGMENIYLNGTIMGYSKEEMDQKLEAIIEFADIGEFIGQPVKMYSSGMFARLAFAVVINVDPDILIIDEALSVGDMAFQNKCFQKMASFIENNKSILFVSHSLSAIRLLCDRVIWLDKGEIVEIGETKAVTQRYEKYMQGQTIETKKDEDIDNKYSEFVVDRLCLSGEKAENAGCYISDITVSDGTRDKSLFSTFDALHIEVLINNKTNGILSVGIGLAIARHDGLEVTRVNNIRDNQSINIKSGYVTIELDFPELYLLDGEYYLSFYLSNSDLIESYHKLENFIKINIETPYAPCGWKISEGVITIPHRWNIA